MMLSDSLSDSNIDHTHSNGHMTSPKKGKSPSHYGNKGSLSDEDQISFSYSSDEEFLPDMIKKKKTTSTSKKKPSSPSNKSTPLSEPPSPAKTPKVKSTVRSKLASSHKERNIQTLGNATPLNMCDTTAYSRASTEATPHSPHAHTSSHHPQLLHSSQLQPSQPHRRYEDKKKDDLFSLEKKRRRLSSMNMLRKSTTTPHTPDVSDTKTLQMPSIAFQGKTMKKNSPVKTPGKLSVSSSDSDLTLPDKKTHSTQDLKRRISSMLSDSDSESVPMATKQVSPPPDKMADNQKPLLALWKADGMLNSSSSETSDNEKKQVTPKTDIVDRMKSIFSDSESENELPKKVRKPSPKPTKHAKTDKPARKRKVFSDSSSSSEDKASAAIKPVKGLPLPSKGDPRSDRELPHTTNHKPKSAHAQHKPSEVTHKRPLDHHHHDHDDSVAKKLRLVDIDFTGCKMRPAPQVRPAASKLTPLKKLRLQSQKSHHRPVSVLHQTKTSDGNERKTEHKTISPEKSSTKESTKDSHHRKSDKKSHDFSGKRSHDSSQRSHDSGKRSHDLSQKSQDSGKRSHDSSKRSHDSSQKSHDSGKTLFAHKNAILAAKFPQKRNLVSEHS